MLIVPWFLPLKTGATGMRKDRERKGGRGGKKEISQICEKKAVPGASPWSTQSIQYSVLTWA